MPTLGMLVLLAYMCFSISRTEGWVGVLASLALARMNTHTEVDMSCLGRNWQGKWLRTSCAKESLLNG